MDMTIIYRPGTLADSYSVFTVFFKSLLDYGERVNVMAFTGGSGPGQLESTWQRRKDLFDFLAETASQFWIAERDGEILGYARAIEHDGLQELTEFFVAPDQQSAGIGSGLLSRAFAKSGARIRTIIATLDERALFNYMRMGVYGRTLLKYFSRQAEKVRIDTDLAFERMDLDLHLDAIHRVDREILSYTREGLHRWLANQREGFVYLRNGEVVGYGYLGGNHGPIALLNDDDFPAVLAHAESRMAEQGGEFGISVPLINRKALDYLVGRKYKIDAFSVLLMSNVPFGNFENYLTFAPEFFL